MLPLSSHLQLRDHAGLSVIAGTVLVDQALGQHLGVELLEDVFVLNVLEHNHLVTRKTQSQKTPGLDATCILCKGQSTLVIDLRAVKVKHTLQPSFKTWTKSRDNISYSLKRNLYNYYLNNK